MYTMHSQKTQLPGFDITESLPFDLMHTIFKGVVPHHLNLLLHYLLNEKKHLTLSAE